MLWATVDAWWHNKAASIKGDVPFFFFHNFLKLKTQTVYMPSGSFEILFDLNILILKKDINLERLASFTVNSLLPGKLCNLWHSIKQWTIK